MTETNLNGQTLDIVAENAKKLRELFPEIVVEDKIDFTRLQDVLGNYMERNEESYRFTWYGKSDAFRKSQIPSTGTLRPYPDENESKNWDITQNLYIEGDNLEVLKLLQKSYGGQVKMIYIDPPYNKDKDFIYPDKWSDPIKEYKRITGQLDDEGNITTSDDESEGGRHTRWLNMMYPRLRLASNLLKEDGVIFISIDDDEIANLKRLCNDVFGEENFVAEFIWAAGRKNDSKFVSLSHEYILCYAKSFSLLKENKVEWRERKQGLDEIYAAYNKFKKQFGEDYAEIQSALKNWYKALPDTHPANNHSHYSCVDKKGVYFAADISWPGGGGPKYDVLHPVTKKPVSIPARGWMFSSPERMQEVLEDDRVHFGTDEKSVPCIKSYLCDKEYSVPYSVFYKDGRAATKRLRGIFGNDVFQNPKDEEVLRSLMEFTLTEDSIILDFFSGSATTAHSLFLQSILDQKKRRFIMVQLPENLDNAISKADNKAKKILKNAIDFLEGIGKPHLLTELGKERIRRAGQAIKMELQQKYDAYMQKQQSLIPSNEPAPMNPDDLDIGFKVFKLDTSNLKRWSVDVGDDFYNLNKDEQNSILAEKLGFEVNNFVEGRSELDMVYEIMLKYGLDLSYPIETYTFDGKNVYSVGMGGLIICLDNGLNEKLADDIVWLVNELEPNTVRVVVKDLSFINDSGKTNFKETLKTGISLYFAKEDDKANKKNQFEFITI